MDDFMGAMIAPMLNNEGYALQLAENYAGAEAKFLEALKLKIKHNGENLSAVALTRNALGELYMKTGRMNDAVYHLEKAVRVREVKSQIPSLFRVRTEHKCILVSSPDEAADSRDNLARAWERNGDLKKAAELRLKRAPYAMSCTYYDCRRNRWPLVATPLRLSDVKACGRCKAAFYCGKDCQRKDWKDGHKLYCKAAETPDSST